MKLSQSDIRELRELAAKLNLDNKERLLDTPDDIVADVCNGIGPEWFPQVIRTAIDRLHPSLVIVSVIHDLDFYYGDGTMSDFTGANARFATNGRKVAKHRYSWFDVRRYFVIHSAKKFAAICEIAGLPAYNIAIRDRVKHEKNLRAQISTSD